MLTATFYICTLVTAFLKSSTVNVIARNRNSFLHKTASPRPSESHIKLIIPLPIIIIITTKIKHVIRTTTTTEKKPSLTPPPRLKLFPSLIKSSRFFLLISQLSHKRKKSGRNFCKSFVTKCCIFCSPLAKSSPVRK